MPPRSLAWRGARSLALPSNPLEADGQPNSPPGPEIPEPQGTPGLPVFLMLGSGPKGYKPGPVSRVPFTQTQSASLCSQSSQTDVKRGQDGNPGCYLQYRCRLLGSQTTAQGSSFWPTQSQSQKILRKRGRKPGGKESTLSSKDNQGYVLPDMGPPT